MSAARQWGDWAPVGATITIPNLNAYLQSILNSDGIEAVEKNVQVRQQNEFNPVGNPVGVVALSTVITDEGGLVELIPQYPGSIADVPFEILLNLAALDNWKSAPNVNAAELQTAWAAALASDAAITPNPEKLTPAMDDVIEGLFPGVDLAIYKSNREAYQAELAASQAASNTGGQNPPAI